MKVNSRLNALSNQAPVKKRSKNWGWVLASITDMINETLHFCEQFAHTLHVHHNESAARVFEAAASSFQQELALVKMHQQGTLLPVIAPWETPHADYEHPANLLMDADYLMSEAQAWKLAEKLVQIHGCFYNYLKTTQSIEETHQLVTALQIQCQQCVVQAKQHLPQHHNGFSDLDEAQGQS